MSEKYDNHIKKMNDFQNKFVITPDTKFSRGKINGVLICFTRHSSASKATSQPPFLTDMTLHERFN